MPEQMQEQGGSEQQQNDQTQLELPLSQTERSGAKDGSDTHVESPFVHPLLRGKSPEQVEQTIRLMESTIREQGAELSKRVEQPSAPAPVREERIDSKSFWDNPVEVMQKLIEQQIQPLQEELRTAKQEIRAPSIRERLRSKYPMFSQLEPQIDLLLQKQRVSPESASPELLETLYFTAKGYVMEHGLLESAPAPRREEPVNTPQRGATPIPQHRPSPAPMPRSESPAPRQRELNEYERRLAKEYFPGVPEGEAFKQYIQWQEADIEDVVNANFDRPK